MITTTSINLSVQIKIYHAMRRAATKNCAQTILNKKGEPSIKVFFFRGYGRAFAFLDKHGRDITETVYKAIKLSN